MAWTEITRPRYQSDGVRYGSDTTDPEWSLIEPLMPPPCERGRTRTTRLRDVVDATSASIHSPSAGSLAHLFSSGSAEDEESARSESQEI
jgi:hypothetical protein